MEGGRVAKRVASYTWCWRWDLPRCLVGVPSSPLPLSPSLSLLSLCLFSLSVCVSVWVRRARMAAPTRSEDAVDAKWDRCLTNAITLTGQPQPQPRVGYNQSATETQTERPRDRGSVCVMGCLTMAWACVCRHRRWGRRALLPRPLPKYTTPHHTTHRALSQPPSLSLNLSLSLSLSTSLSLTLPLSQPPSLSTSFFSPHAAALVFVSDRGPAALPGRTPLAHHPRHGLWRRHGLCPMPVRVHPPSAP